jgi:hypothetical protein
MPIDCNRIFGFDRLALGLSHLLNLFIQLLVVVVVNGIAVSLLLLLLLLLMLGCWSSRSFRVNLVNNPIARRHKGTSCLHRTIARCNAQGEQTPKHSCRCLERERVCGWEEEWQCPKALQSVHKRFGERSISSFELRTQRLASLLLLYRSVVVFVRPVIASFSLPRSLLPLLYALSAARTQPSCQYTHPRPVHNGRIL